MISKSYKTIAFLIILILVLGLLVVLFSPRQSPSSDFVYITATTTPEEMPLPVITPDNNNTTVHLTQNERFIINLGHLNWTFVFSPSDVIGRVSSTTDNTGQGIYQAGKSATTRLYATGAPICAPNQMCPQFRESMTITFVVE